MRGAFTVFRKEILETVRDRRTLLIMVVVPVLLYPALLIISEQLALFGIRQLRSEPVEIAVVGATPQLRAFIDSDVDLDVVPEVPEDPAAFIRGDTVKAVVVVGPSDGFTQEFTVMYDAADERSGRGRAEARAAIDAWGDSLLARRLAAEDLPASFAQPVAVADSSVALPSEVGSSALGRFLPMLLIIITLLGTFYPAIDLAAGEKERGTLETLLTAPVPSDQIVMGKFLTVATVGVLAAALNLGSMYLTFQTGLFRFAAATDVEFSLPFKTVLAIFSLLVPLAVLFGSTFLGIAVNSRSFKEAQNALTPVYMLALVPALLPIFPGIELTEALAVVPVAGVSLFFRALMIGEADAVTASLAMLSTVAYAVLALRFAANAFGREDVLFGEGASERRGPLTLAAVINRYRSGATGSGHTPDFAQSMLFVAMVALLFFHIGRAWQAQWLERGLFLSEWLLLLLPTLVFVFIFRFSARKTLSIRAPSKQALLGGALLMAGGTPLAWFVAWAQSFFLPIPFELAEGIADMLTPESTGDLMWLLLLAAITPAICEEAVFRGGLMGGMRKMNAFAAILINGAIFGLFHVSFESAFRFGPTAFIGILMAYAVWHSRSIFVSVLMHFMNNGLIVMMVAYPSLASFLGNGSEPRPPFILFLPALILAIVGATLLRRASLAAEPNTDPPAPESVPNLDLQPEAS